MDALLNPLNRTKEGIKWGLTMHTTTMFSFATIFTGMTLHIQSISCINSREFTGDTVLPPGPLGYQVLIYSKAIGIVPSVFFAFNQWLADGLLVSSVSSQSLGCLMQALPLALSLLRHLCQELLGYRLPIPDVPCYLGYVFEHSANQQRHCQLMPSSQGWVSYSSIRPPSRVASGAL